MKKIVLLCLILSSAYTAFSQQTKLSSGIHKQVVETEKIPSGLYLIRLQAGGKQSISRISIQH